MNDLLKQRIARALDALSDDRGYQILDYIEFLESKYAERARPGGIFAKLTETVEDTMRAGKLPIQAISGTMGLVDGAAKVMKGLAAAGLPVDPDEVETNFVQLEVGPLDLTTAEALARLREAGVGFSGTVHPTTLRAVTHLDVTDEDIERAIELVPGALTGALAPT